MRQDTRGPEQVEGEGPGLPEVPPVPDKNLKIRFTATGFPERDSALKYVTDIYSSDNQVGNMIVMDVLIVTDIDHLSLRQWLKRPFPVFTDENIPIARKQMMDNNKKSVILVAYMDPALEAIDEVMARYRGALLDYWGADGTVHAAMRRAHAWTGHPPADDIPSGLQVPPAPTRDADKI